MDNFRTHIKVLWAAVIVTMALLSWWPASAVAEKNPYAKLFREYQRPSNVPFPKDNRHTLARYQLGKMLFFDPRLSGSNILSCASCHNPAFSWGDGLPRAVGHGMAELGRRTPTILNLAWGEAYFWDGRAESLEDQALKPIEAAGEMNLPRFSIVNDRGLDRLWPDVATVDARGARLVRRFRVLGDGS